MKKTVFSIYAKFWDLLAKFLLLIVGFDVSNANS